MNSKLLKYYLFLLLGFTLISCNHNVFYQKIDAVPKEVWNIDSVYHYQFEISDSLQYYNMYINLRNTIDYPYQNFYIFCTTVMPNGVSFTDTLGGYLCDYYGQWFGKGSGRIKDNKFLLRRQVRFQQKGVYNISIKHAMRTDDLKGIANVGITLNKFKEEKNNR